MADGQLDRQDPRDLPPRPQGLDDFVQQDYQRERPTNRDVPVSTEISKVNPQAVLVGTDGRREANPAIAVVNNYDREHRIMGSSQYVYGGGANGNDMNGYIDRDADGNVKEFAVRKVDPNGDVRKDMFLVFRARPGENLDPEQMKRVFGLLRTDLPRDVQARNQAILNDERPLADNILPSRGDTLTGILVDPNTGKRFEMRRQLTAPTDSNPDRRPQLHDFISWDRPDGKKWRIDRNQLDPNSDEAIVRIATRHGNMRTSFNFLSSNPNVPNPGQFPQPPRERVQRIPPPPPPGDGGYNYDTGPDPSRLPQPYDQGQGGVTDNYGRRGKR